MLTIEHHYPGTPSCPDVFEDTLLSAMLNYLIYQHVIVDAFMEDGKLNLCFKNGSYDVISGPLETLNSMVSLFQAVSLEVRLP